MARFGTISLCSSVCAAICAMTGAAASQSRSDATVFDRAPETFALDEPRAPSPPTLTIEDVFERDVTDGCRYTAHLRGSVRTRPNSERSDDSVRFVADVRVATQLQCGTVLTRGPVRTVRGEHASLADLERAISEASTLRTAVTGYECRYEPRFEFDGTQFQGRTIAQACRYQRTPVRARGGGPPASRTPPLLRLPPSPVEQNAGRSTLVP